MFDRPKVMQELGTPIDFAASVHCPFGSLPGYGTSPRLAVGTNAVRHGRRSLMPPVGGIIFCV